MDPNACVDRILSAIRAQDEEEIIEAFGDLREWLHKGGFHPRETAHRDLCRALDEFYGLDWLETHPTVNNTLDQLGW